MQLAVAGTPGVRNMGRQLSCRTGGWSFLETEGNAQRVTCITLPEIFDQWKLDHVDVLKMDIEGAEYEIIRETPISILQKIKKISMEFHDYHGFHYTEIVDKLQAAGFSVTVRPDRFYQCTKVGYIDAIRS